VTQVSTVIAGRTSALPEVVLLPGLGNLSYAEQWVAKFAAWTRAVCSSTIWADMQTWPTTFRCEL
jgi:hypothetical protein